MAGTGMRVTVALAVTMAVASVPAASGAEAPRQSAAVRFTTTTPGAPSGLSTAIDWANPSDRTAKPYAVDKIVFRYAHGVALDYSVPEQCKASDAELEAQGASACPTRSRVATGTIVTDSGASGGPFPRFVDVNVENFNNQDELIGVGDATNVPVVPGFTRTVTRSRIVDGSFTTDFPDVPTGSPPDGYDALKSLRISSEPIVRNGRAYLRTPSVCPATGFWTNSLTFVYHDGVEQTVDSASPCRPRSKAAPAAPRLSFHVAPRGRCAARRFSIRTSISDPSRLRNVVLRLDGHRLLATTRKRFRLHVDADDLPAGGHRFELTARDVAGWVGHRTAQRRRCG